MTNLTRKSNNTKPRDWSTIDRTFDSLLDEVVAPFSTSRSKTSNITETENGYEWSVDMPGVGRENIDISFNESTRMLTVSADTEDRSYNYSVRLGSGVDSAAISAEYDKGVLAVTLPKSDRDENVRQIEIT